MTREEGIKKLEELTGCTVDRYARLIDIGDALHTAVNYAQGE